MNFNERLRYLIDCEESNSKTLHKLCLSASTLSNYTQGIREPDYDTLRRIADYFGVSIDYLLGHGPPPSMTTPAFDVLPQLHPQPEAFLLDQGRVDQSVIKSGWTTDRPAGCGGPVFFWGENLRRGWEASPPPCEL